MERDLGAAPDWHCPNPDSQVLALCERRIVADWPARFGQPLLLLETFVDPSRFQGTLHRAANWTPLGLTQGFRRTRLGYSTHAPWPRRVFVRPLRANARAARSQPILNLRYRTGAPRMMLTTEQRRTLPDCLADIADPRCAQGRCHPLPAVLAIATAAVLCGMRGYTLGGHH